MQAMVAYCNTYHFKIMKTALPNLANYAISVHWPYSTQQNGMEGTLKP